MKRYVILLALAMSSPATAQEYPKPTAAGEEALESLVQRCVAAGGLKRVAGDKPGVSTLNLGDTSKLKPTIEEARGTLNHATFDALIARTADAVGDHEAAMIALLRAVGEVADDGRAVAFAILIEALRSQKAEDVFARLEDATRRFQSCKELAWQGVCIDAIGGVFYENGDLAKALDGFLKALEIRRAVLGERHSKVAASYNNIATVYADQGEHAKVLEGFGSALAALGMTSVLGKGDDASLGAPSPTPDPLVPKVLVLRGKLRELLPRPDPAAALADYRRAADALDRLRDSASFAEDKVSKAEDVSELFPRAVGASARLAAASGNSDPSLEALAFAERGAARVFLEGLGRSRASAGGRVDPATLADEARLTAEIREIDGRIAKEQDKHFEKRDRAVVERLFVDRKRADEAWRALVARMEREVPQYAALKHPRPCSIAEARACLADDEVALLFVLGSKASYLVVVCARGDGATGGIAIRPLPPDETIAEAVVALTQEKVLKDPEATRERGAVLYQMLLAPAAGAIAGKRLVIVPGGVLGQLPFELLAEPGGEGGSRFLVEGHAIRYAPSLTALHMIRRWEGERPEPRQALWALGDPVYTKNDERLAAGRKPSAEAIQLASRLRGGTRGEGFERLDGSGIEVEHLAALMGSRSEERLLGADATEAAVKRLSADGTLVNYRYIHFGGCRIAGRMRHWRVDSSVDETTPPW